MAGREQSPPTTLDAGDLEGILADLRTAHARFARNFPGDSVERQPVHTVYGGAQLFRADSAPQDRGAGAEVARPVRAGSGGIGWRAGAAGDRAGTRATARSHRRQADARAGRGLSDRFRGRIRPPARCRRGRAQRECRDGGGGGRPPGNPPAFHRHPHQAGLGGTASAQPAHARPVRHGAREGARWRVRPGIPCDHSEGRRSRADRRRHARAAKRSNGG